MTTTANRDGPPGPPGRPVIGNAGQARRGVLDFFTENARTYGDIVYFEIFNEGFYQLTHPDDIQRVLVEDNQRFIKGRLNRTVLAPVIGDGLFTSEGETWRAQRHRIQPAFHPDQISVYGDIMTECTQRMLDEWSAGDRLDIHEAMKGLTLEIVAQALLGVEIRRDIQTIGRNLDIILRYIDSTPNLFLPRLRATGDSSGPSGRWNRSSIGLSPTDGPRPREPMSCRGCSPPRTNRAIRCVLGSFGTR